jgi:hypothetical protein
LIPNHPFGVLGDGDFHHRVAVFDDNLLGRLVINADEHIFKLGSANGRQNLCTLEPVVRLRQLLCNLDCEGGWGGGG